MNNDTISTIVEEESADSTTLNISSTQNQTSEQETITINSVYEVKESSEILPKIKSFLKTKAVFWAVMIFFMAMALISFISIIKSVVPVTVVVDTEKILKLKQSSQETPTQTPVPAIKEKWQFKKSAYKVEAGKKITVVCQCISKDNKKKSSEPQLTYVSENPEIAIVDQKGNVTGKRCGTTTIVAISDTGICTTVPLTVTVPKTYKIKYVPYIYQGEKYPSGCESVSTVMLLQYMGFKITVEEFIDDYLPKGEISFNKKGEMCAPDPYTAFLGSPYTEEALGCYPSVIQKAVTKYLKEKKKTENYRAIDLTGVSVRYLTEHYITNNQPVVIWATMFMANPVVTEEWIVKGADKDSPYKDGDKFEWKANEHCMLLVGYDEEYYYLHDPLSQKETAYDKDTFEDRFKGMGRFALVVDKIS